MTDRKPPGVSFETWTDRQIREAQERGAFEGLTGKGKPLHSANASYDELWWVKDKMRREGLSFLPPSLALRKEAEDAEAAIAEAVSERQVRRILDVINEKIEAAIRRPPPGPPLNRGPFDVERTVAEWHERRQERAARRAAAEPGAEPGVGRDEQQPAPERPGPPPKRRLRGLRGRLTGHGRRGGGADERRTQQHERRALDGPGAPGGRRTQAAPRAHDERQTHVDERHANDENDERHANDERRARAEQGPRSERGDRAV